MPEKFRTQESTPEAKPKPRVAEEKLEVEKRKVSLLVLGAQAIETLEVEPGTKISDLAVSKTYPNAEYRIGAKVVDRSYELQDKDELILLPRRLAGGQCV